MNKIRRSKAVRQDPLSIRGEYNGECCFDIPLMRKSDVCDPNIQFISFQSVKTKDTINLGKAVHFFVDDYKFEKVYRKPHIYIKQLAKYKYVLTPDFSLLTDMPLWIQLYNVARSRWCGRTWQEAGLDVIPSIGWSTVESHKFAFLGIEKGSVVAVSTVGARRSKNVFLEGYEAMLSQIAPSVVYCYGTPFPEMRGTVIPINYLASTGRCN